MKVSITYDDTLYQLVPKEATLDMHKAYRDVISIGSELDAAMVYRSMLAASPTPPAQPAERKPLTRDELSDLVPGTIRCAWSDFVSIARVIEAAHGIKGES